MVQYKDLPKSKTIPSIVLLFAVAPQTFGKIALHKLPYESKIPIKKRCKNCIERSLQAKFRS
ncbi:MAG: hypothetical protein ACK5RV_06555, partial [Flavobacterium sp.]